MSKLLFIISLMLLVLSISMNSYALYFEDETSPDQPADTTVVVKKEEPQEVEPQVVVAEPTETEKAVLEYFTPFIEQRLTQEREIENLTIELKNRAKLDLGDTPGLDETLKASLTAMSFLDQRQTSFIISFDMITEVTKKIKDAETKKLEYKQVEELKHFTCQADVYNYASTGVVLPKHKRMVGIKDCKDEDGKRLKLYDTSGINSYEVSLSPDSIKIDKKTEAYLRDDVVEAHRSVDNSARSAKKVEQKRSRKDLHQDCSELEGKERKECHERVDSRINDN